MLETAIVIVTALLFHQTNCDQIKNVDVCKNEYGNLSFSGWENGTKTHVMNTNVCTTTDASFLLLELPKIDTVLCMGKLKIPSYMRLKNILDYRKETCFLMTSNKFSSDLFDVRRPNCSVIAWVRNENIFPASVRFNNDGSDEKCSFDIKYTFISNSTRTVTKDCCTTSEPSATQGHNDDEESNYWGAMAFLGILLTLLLAGFVPLWAREFEFNHPEIFRRQPREALPNREE